MCIRLFYVQMCTHYIIQSNSPYFTDADTAQKLFFKLPTETALHLSQDAKLNHEL